MLQQATSFSSDYLVRPMIPSMLSIQFYRRLSMTPEAERFNGWAAMLGFVAAVGAYVTTGQIIPGIF